MKTAKIKVLIDGLKALIMSMVVEFEPGDEVTVSLVYEKLENQCTFCYKFDHKAKDCPSNQADPRPTNPINGVKPSRSHQPPRYSNPIHSRSHISTTSRSNYIRPEFLSNPSKHIPLSRTNTHPSHAYRHRDYRSHASPTRSTSSRATTPPYLHTSTSRRYSPHDSRHKQSPTNQRQVWREKEPTPSARSPLMAEQTIGSHPSRQ